MDSSTRRFVYVLIGWQERPASAERPAVWRFSLEDTRANQRLGFGNLCDLVVFLEAEMKTAELRSERDKNSTPPSAHVSTQRTQSK